MQVLKNKDGWILNKVFHRYYIRHKEAGWKKLLGHLLAVLDFPILLLLFYFEGVVPYSKGMRGMPILMMCTLGFFMVAFLIYRKYEGYFKVLRFNTKTDFFNIVDNIYAKRENLYLKEYYCGGKYRLNTVLMNYTYRRFYRYTDSNEIIEVMIWESEDLREIEKVKSLFTELGVTVGC